MQPAQDYPSDPGGKQEPHLGAGRARGGVQGVEFWGHCPHGPRANTRPLFPGPWGRGGEGASGRPLPQSGPQTRPTGLARAAQGARCARSRGPRLSLLPSPAREGGPPPTNQLCARWGRRSRDRGWRSSRAIRAAPQTPAAALVNHRPGRARPEARATPRWGLPDAAGAGSRHGREKPRRGEGARKAPGRAGRPRGSPAPRGPPRPAPTNQPSGARGADRPGGGAGSSPNTRVPAALTDQHAQHVEHHEDPPPLHAAPAPAPGRARDPRRRSQRVPSRPGPAAGSHGRGARLCQGGAGRGGEGRGAAGRRRSSRRAGGGLCPRPAPPGRGEPGGAG